jgi:hypothetical protein
MKKGELLERVEEWKILIDKKLDCHWYKRDEEAYKEIVAIINQPTITKKDTRNKSLGKLAEDLKISFSAAKIISDHAQPTITKKNIKEWAGEARYRVEAHKDWGYVTDVIQEMLTEIGVPITVDKEK